MPSHERVCRAPVRVVLVAASWLVACSAPNAERPTTVDMVAAPNASTHVLVPPAAPAQELGLDVAVHISGLVTYELESADGSKFLSFSYGVNDPDVDSVAAAVYTDDDTVQGSRRQERVAIGHFPGQVVFARRGGERPRDAMFAIAREQGSALSLWLTTTDAEDEARFRQTITSFRSADERRPPTVGGAEWHRVGRFAFAAPKGLRIHAAHFFSSPEQVRVDWEPDCDAATSYVLSRRIGARTQNVEREIAGRKARFVVVEADDHVERLGVTPFGTRCLAVTYQCEEPQSCTMTDARWDALYASALKTGTPL